MSIVLKDGKHGDALYGSFRVFLFLTSAVCQLSKGHSAELSQTSKSFNLVVSAITLYVAIKGSPRKKIY